MKPLQQRFDLPKTAADFKYEEQPLPDEYIKFYEEEFLKKGLLKPGQKLSELEEGSALDFFTKEYNREEKIRQFMQLPGSHGTQDWRGATGGRVPFGGGGMGRREFLAWLGSVIGGIAGVKSGLVKFGIGKGKGTVAVKVGDKIIKSTEGMPDWFVPLVNRIVKEGDDVTKKLGTVEREIVHTKSISKTEDVTVYQNLDTGDFRVEYGSPEFDKTGKVIRASNDPDVVHLEYKAPEEVVTKKGSVKTKSEFSAMESEPEVVNWDGDIEKSGEHIVGKVDDLVTDTSKLKEYGTGKKLNIKDRLKAEQKKKYQKKLQKDPLEQIDYIEGKGGASIDDILDEGKRVGDFDPKGYDTHNLWKGQNLPKKKTKKASGGSVDYDNYLPDIDDID